MACRRSASSVLVLLATLGSGCGSAPEKHTANKPVVEPAAETPAAEKDGTDGSEREVAGEGRRSLEESLAARLEKLEMQLAGLRETVGAFPETLRKEWLDTVATLDDEARAARRRLGELGRATHEVWDGLRDDASAAWERLEAAVKKALADVERARSEAEPAVRPAEPDAAKA